MPEDRLTTLRHPAVVAQTRVENSDHQNLKVAYVTQWFAPEPSNIPQWIATSLRRQGLNIEVLTGVPNYPTGKTYPGYSAWRRSREVINGFDVFRAPLYPSHGRSSVGRILNLASYAVSSTFLNTSSLRSADVCLVYSSPATAAVAAMQARQRWGTPYVLLILDMWPDSVFASNFLTRGPARRIAEKTLRSFTNRAYKGAAHVAVTSPGMRDLLLERGVPEYKLSVIYNWTDEQVMKPTEADDTVRNRLGLSNSFILMYAGNHGAAQKLDCVITAMSYLADRPDVQLVMVGDGSVKGDLQRQVVQLNLSNVHFVDPVEADQVPGLMASADIQLVALANQELFRITMPSKVQSIMACAQPILLSAAGDAAEAVERAGAGITCPPENPHELALAIRRAHATPKGDLEAMGRSGHEFYRSRMSEAVSSRALADALRSAAAATIQ